MLPIEISTDPKRLDVEVIHAFLNRSYWAEGIPRNLVERSIRGSLNFGAYAGSAQVGYARVVTDGATFYLADVFVLEDYRRMGISKILMRTILDHPDLQGLWRWSLVTRDAHELYEQFGFRRPVHPERYMEIARPGLYRSIEQG